IILKNHGTVSFGKDLVDAYWKTEILDAYCRILLLSKQLGPPEYLNEQKSRELLDLKKKLGFDDPRFHNENCDLCGNSAFRDGYKEQIPVQRAFPKAPDFPGYLQEPAYAKQSSCSTPAAVSDDVVKMITDQVLAALSARA
ncbi:MAG: class II aldolase/adducin family protein, partial [Planctomycetaceae bacterium]|nr:class II aldolase/adducin family protein [Planctomycetaceae bacterium]